MRTRKFSISLTALLAGASMLGVATTASARGDDTQGYWVATSKGASPAFGDAPVLADAAGGEFGSCDEQPDGSFLCWDKFWDPIALAAPITDFEAHRSGSGSWQLAADGGVFAFDVADFYGSPVGEGYGYPWVDLAPTPSGKGYVVVAQSGAVRAYGDAVARGQLATDCPRPGVGEVACNLLPVPHVRPVVAIETTPSGKGYWLTADDGGVFAYGDAAFFGSTGGLVLNQPIVGMARTPSGKGYWLVASDGGIFAFGDAQFFGSTGGLVLNQPIVGMAATPTGNGYWLVASDGGVFSFGDARFAGSAVGLPPGVTAVAIDAYPG